MGKPSNCFSGRCDETTPAIRLLSRTGVIDSDFLANEYIPGQTSATLLNTIRYAFKNNEWSSTNLPIQHEGILDIARDGQNILGVIKDRGCCGLVNESIDSTYLWNGKTKLEFYNEDLRFKNASYEVSFFSVSGYFSPVGKRVVHTLAAVNGNFTASEWLDAQSTPSENFDIRLSTGIKENPTDRSRIISATREMPLAEAWALEKNGKLIKINQWANSHAIGWVDDESLILFRKGQVFRYDLHTRKERVVISSVASAYRVFLR